MTTRQIYGYLVDHNFLWGHKDTHHIWVRMPGYKHADCYELEKKLMPTMSMVSEEFDRYVGQTVLIFKHE
jgi:hypothetical protein